MVGSKNIFRRFVDENLLNAVFGLRYKFLTKNYFKNSKTVYNVCSAIHLINATRYSFAQKFNFGGFNSTVIKGPPSVGKTTVGTQTAGILGVRSFGNWNWLLIDDYSVSTYLGHACDCSGFTPIYDDIHKSKDTVKPDAELIIRTLFSQAT